MFDQFRSCARRTELEEAGFGWLLDVDYPAQPPDVAWPTEAWPTGPLPDGVDHAAVQAIVDEAFRPVIDDAGNEAGKVDALLAVSGGRLVLEAYNGWELTTVAHDLDGVGVISGGSNINMSAQDFARFGLLYLRGGEWDGRQIVPQEWVDYARRPRPDATQYGAHWWVDHDADAQRVAFFADGFAGQLLVVVPSLDLVVVALANSQDGRSDDAAWALVDAFTAGRRTG